MIWTTFSGNFFPLLFAFNLQHDIWKGKKEIQKEHFKCIVKNWFDVKSTQLISIWLLYTIPIIVKKYLVLHISQVIVAMSIGFWVCMTFFTDIRIHFRLIKLIVQFFVYNSNIFLLSWQRAHFWSDFSVYWLYQIQKKSSKQNDKFKFIKNLVSSSSFLCRRTN